MAINTNRVIESAARPRPMPGLYLNVEGTVILVSRWHSKPRTAPAFPGSAMPAYQAVDIEGDEMGRCVSLTEGQFETLRIWPGAITLQNEVDLP
jgi:hypothetical protein